MTDPQFEALTKQLEQGKQLSVLEQFLYDQEKQRRAVGPNILQKQEAARHSGQLRN